MGKKNFFLSGPTPKWVLDHLQTRDSNKIDSLVIIIVDA